jgi:putative peptidoglycan lipid II flippase
MSRTLFCYGRPLEHVSRNLRIVSVCTAISRVLGMVRDAVMAATFGAGPVLDAFALAFRIPNLARSILGEGAVATAFLPVLVAELNEGGKPAASRLTSALLATLAAGMGVFVLIAELVLWWWGSAWTLGPEAELLQRLLVILAPYLILVCLTAQVSTLLHASGEFLWPALIPIGLNVVWLLSLWGMVPWWSDPATQVQVMAACVVAAGGLQFLLPLSAVWRLGYRPMGDWRRSMSRVGEILHNVWPVLLGLSITQLNTAFDSLVAWGLAKPVAGADAIAWLGGVPYPLTSGTSSALYFAQRLYQFPLGVFGVALGTVLYPLLSAHAQRGDWAQLRSDYALGLRLVAAIGLPASAGLMLLAEPLAAGCFRYGKFDAEATRQTAQMIAAYGVGVWAYCALLIVHRGYYALGDRLTPLYVGFGAFGVNTVLNLTSIWWLGGVGLALSTAVTAMLQCAMAGWLLQRRLGGVEWTSCRAAIVKTLFATALMYAAGDVVLASLPDGQGLADRAVRVVAPLTVSLLVFFAVAALIRLQEPWELIRRSRRTEAVAESIDGQ